VIGGGRVDLDAARRRLYLILDRAISSDPTSVVVHGGLITLVFASVVAIVLESVADLNAAYGPTFELIEDFAAGVFTIEFLARVWTAPEYRGYAGRQALRARLHFLWTPSAIVDLLSVAPIYLQLFVPTDLKVLLLLRLVRFFKLARYSPGMRSLIAVFEAERKALLATAVLLCGLVLIAASAMHLVEHDAQPDKFASIPESMWWAVVTLTTVGYGDVVPVTFLGRLVAGVTMLMGIITLALPIGIVATAFAEEIHRREFVVTWSMIAGVPLFRTLNAAEIADIMRYLRARTAPVDTLIVRRGEPATSMYFIASGEVEVELPGDRIRLAAGQFFGEIALLKNQPRSATVRAVRPTKLLVLDAADLRALMERNPDIGTRIAAVAEERSGFNRKAGVPPADASGDGA
jgi:voltage-gated potassium channel